jgi:hypothetical protein
LILSPAIRAIDRPYSDRKMRDQRRQTERNESRDCESGQNSNEIRQRCTNIPASRSKAVRPECGINDPKSLALGHKKKDVRTRHFLPDRHRQAIPAKLSGPNKLSIGEKQGIANKLSCAMRGI